MHRATNYSAQHAAAARPKSVCLDYNGGGPDFRALPRRSVQQQPLPQDAAAAAFRRVIIIKFISHRRSVGRDSGGQLAL